MVTRLALVALVAAFAIVTPAQAQHPQSARLIYTDTHVALAGSTSSDATDTPPPAPTQQETLVPGVSGGSSWPTPRTGSEPPAARKAPSWTNATFPARDGDPHRAARWLRAQPDRGRRLRLTLRVTAAGRTQSKSVTLRGSA